MSEVQRDYLAEELERVLAERDRLRKMIGTALQVIPRNYEDLSPVKKSRVIRDAKIALQEVVDERT